MPDSFVHLHVHTEYSILDGASRLEEVINAAAADGQPALGITDHGNMYGVLDFYRGCHAAGIKPIIGAEAYMAHDSRYERPTRRGRVDDAGGDTEGGGKLYYHLTLLATSNAGYKNLIQVVSRAYLEGYYYKPRCDWETLSDHAEGLVATSGCLGGQVAQALLHDDPDEALRRAGRFQDIFGRENFYVEMQDHGIPEQRRINPMLLEIAHKLNAPLLGTNDSHYTHRHDAEAHDALLCVQTGALLHDEDRFKFHGNEHYLKSAAEMRHLFGDLPGACDNTLSLAERAEVTIEFGKPQLPNFPLPEGFATDREYLEHLTLAGAHQRWGNPLPDAVADRLAYELEVINNMGFASYFLITWDLIAHARSRNIRVGPGRGSAAGCAVAYALAITDLDPIRYDLLFERFLNPERVSMPDIDMDFDSRYRDDVINYAAERYGRDRVAQIITFGTIKARAAVRDAARVLGYPASLGDRVAKAMPPLILGRDTPLRYCFEDSDAHKDGFVAAAGLRQMVQDDPDAARVVDVARGLENLRRQDGIHAAAVVITPEPLTEYMPIQRKPESGSDPEAAPVVTQYEMHGVEDLGLLKMDFLGLRNLDVISDCVELVRQTRGVTVDVDNLDLDDARTYELLCKGDTAGVFQLESPQVRNLIRSLAPSGFDDVAALVALYRPGPMAANMHNDYADRKNGRKPVKYFHPDARDILADSYGLMIYQESVMRIAQRFAGYSLAEADSLRKAMGKKIREAMAEERQKFVSGVAANGYGDNLGTELFGIVEQFADYAFNKSHSYGYGLIAYQTAYLKANYPVEYLAALLTSVKNRLESAAVYLNDCRAHHIEVGVPDVNRSAADFTPLPDLGQHGDAATNGDPAKKGDAATNGGPATNSGPASNGDAASNGAPAAELASPGRILYGLAAIRNVGDGFAAGVIREREANGAYRSFIDFLERIELGLINKRAIDSLIKAGAFDSLGHSRKGLLDSYEEIVDKVVRTRRDLEQGVMSLFVSLPEVPGGEQSRAEKLAGEKEMLGLYLSDHPMNGLEDEIRSLADATVSDLIEQADAPQGAGPEGTGPEGAGPPGTGPQGNGPDGGFRSVGGVITRLERRYTRKSELMATFWLEDTSGSVEVLVFPRTMHQLDDRLLDDTVVVVRGRVGARDEAVRIIANDITVIAAAETGPAPLRVRLSEQFHNEQGLRRLRGLLMDHPGDSPVEVHLGHGGLVAALPDTYSTNGVGAAGELRELFGNDAVLA